MVELVIRKKEEVERSTVIFSSSLGIIWKFNVMLEENIDSTQTLSKFNYFEMVDNLFFL